MWPYDGVVHPSGAQADTPPDALAAIDVGTNSVHMVVARVTGRDRFEVLTRHKEMVRLGSGGGDMKVLRADAIERGVAALARCRSIAEGFGAEVHAVATSAVREARNAAEFLERASTEAGIEVQVISGVEEARLIQLGVLQALPVYDRRIVLVDVGGGSTEVLFGKGADVVYARSHKLGSLRLGRRFFPDGVVTGTAVEQCRRLIRGRIAPMAHEVAGLGHDVAVASSGTAESLAVMALVRRGEGVPSSMNGVVLPREWLAEVAGDLAAVSTTEERRRLAGIDPARADIILAGALVIEEICDALGIAELTISAAALREGALLDALRRRSGATLHHLHDLRRESVMHLLEACDDDPDHSLQVARLALQLHDLLAGRLGLDDTDRELLEAAALLSNVGLVISHSAHHKHSYYVIRNSEHLTGFTDAEKELIALVARYHRKSPPSEDKHPEFAALGADGRRRVRAMAALLRVAIALDRNHDGGVAFVTGEGVDGQGDGPGDSGPGGGGAPIGLRLHPRGGADLDLERHVAGERVGLLADLLGVPVAIGVAEPCDPPDVAVAG
jgi:exopolyphosphatase/guanosine-5'-triphosphate,3'-diphosphate pyrophosphatase